MSRRVLNRVGVVKGFTLVELIIVIVVIGILATITTIGLTRYQSDARDAQRSSNATSIAEALEKYYDENGEYPSCSMLTDTALNVSTNTLKGLDQSALITPQAPAGTTNSIQCTAVTVDGDDFFEYAGDGSVDCTSGSSCLSFTIKYKNETTGEIETITSRRSTQIDTSGTLALTGSAVPFSSLNLSWNTLQNAINYTIQVSTASNFSSIDKQQVSTTPSATVTGLTPSTTYYARVAGNTQTAASSWSNTLTRTMGHIGTPSPSVSSSNPTTVTISWSAVSGATQYVIERSTSSGFPVGASTTQYTQTGTSRVFSDSSPSTTHYFRVKAVAPDDQSSWSATDSILPIVPPPTAAPSISAAMSGTNAVGTTSATCTYGTPQYGLRYHSENTGTAGSWSSYTAYSSTTTRSVAALQGYQYVFQAQAQCLYLGATSTATTSGTDNIVRSIATPAAPTFTNGTTWSQGVYYTVNYTSYCPSGTSLTIGPSYSGQWMSDGFDPNDGQNYWGAWGSNDKWTFPAGYGSGSTVRYFTNYRCYTTYATSPNSPVTTTTVRVN